MSVGMWIDEETSSEDRQRARDFEREHYGNMQKIAVEMVRPHTEIEKREPLCGQESDKHGGTGKKEKEKTKEEME